MAANSLGATNLGLMVRHIAPNILAPITVLVTLEFPADIISEATLTFLGLGVDPGTPTWGIMVNQAFPAIFSYTSQIIYPSVAIAIATLAFSFFGDGVRDAFDPRTAAK
jgi:peptide/nickel transport system permease protein